MFRYFNQITEFFDQLHKVEDISGYLESLVDSKSDRETPKFILDRLTKKIDPT